MKKIIVSGGAGFIGSHIVDRLLQRNSIETLVVVDNLWTGTLENLEHINDSRLKVEVGRVEDFQSDVKFDEVYHLASPAAPKQYGPNPVDTISANIIGAMRLRELMAPDATFCYTSTSEVYGDPKVSPQPESYLGMVDCTGPRAAYDEGKRVTEAFLFECRRNHGMKIKVVRPFNVYGPRTTVDDGRAVSNFVTQALLGEPITVYGDGQQSRSWGYVDDIVEGFERFFWRDDVDYDGPLNIGNNREIPVLQVAEYVAGLIPGSTISFMPPVPQDPTNRCPDQTNVKKVLPGWDCKVPYEDGVKKTIEWFAEKLQKDGHTLSQMKKIA